ncbi:prepilin peptidase [Candidatus Sulfurimonas baltica]|uniref:Prepilin peptidase n=1 Tax=Candidatus Sulfurimonas baltica TaxID=2740404 RepID=A0A7S7LYV9_9BACT|nr:A24 family peptidase [Candidatus Sulfurimonas baltica]QOY53388.1 prepilin peptidase [Candidatus Sulfurimonas baltica]
MELTISFIFGVLFGSFLNVIILRIPKDESIIFGGSHCTTCGNNLKPWHNIPIFSWLFLRGKCSFCSAKISVQYPIVELISGLIFLLLVNKFGFSTPVVFIALSFFMLLSLSMIDLKYKMVPDSLNLLAMFFAIIGAWSLHGVFTNFQNALLFAGGFTLLRFALSYHLTSSAHRYAKKTITPWTKNYHTYPFIEAMGEGDIMVGATMGALLGIKLTLAAIFLSAILALPIMIFLVNRYGQGQTVPFVPFLVLSTFLVYIFDSSVLTYIEALY